MKTYIQLINLHKQYSTNVLLDNVSLLIEEKSKIGVIGRNGAGKTTLLKILMGEEEADSGEVVFNDELRIGYIRQNSDFLENEIVLDYLIRISSKESWFCAKTAAKFGIDHIKVGREISELSSGYRMRVKLTEMALSEPNFLLLDEPSNFLDLNTLISLENFLLDFNGGYMIVSHDREFLKTTCDYTLEIEPGKVTYFQSGIEDYFDYKDKVTEQVQRYNKNIGDKKEQLEKFVERFRYKASKAAQAQSKLKQIEKLKTIEIGHTAKRVKIRIPNVEEKKGFALLSENLTIGYKLEDGSEKKIAESSMIEIPRGAKVAILGANGEGKTTLLKTFSGELDALSGNYRYAQSTKLGYFAEHLYKNITSHDNVLGFLKRHISKEMNEKELLTLLGSFLFSNNDVYKPVAVLSGGEKSRLMLLATIVQSADMLILDEPTNHLDFETVEALGNALSKYNGTILFTSHDRTFVSMLSDTIIQIDSGKVELYPSNYDDYVYHIRLRTLEEESEEINYEKKQKKNRQQKKDENVSDYHKRKEIKASITKINNDIKMCESKMAEYNNEHQNIIKYLENIEGYDKEKSDRLLELKKLITQEEENWILYNEKKER